MNTKTYTDLDIIKEVLKAFKLKHGYYIITNSAYKSEKTISTLESKDTKELKYIFFTRYDAIGKFDTNDNLIKPLPINWKGNAQEIIDIFESFGFKTSWGGTNEDLIFIETTPKTINTALKALPEGEMVEYERTIYNLENDIFLLSIKYKDKVNDKTFKYLGIKGTEKELRDFIKDRAKRLDRGEFRTYRNLLKNSNDYLTKFEEEFISPREFDFKNFNVFAFVNTDFKKKLTTIEEIVNIKAKDIHSKAKTNKINFILEKR